MFLGAVLPPHAAGAAFPDWRLDGNRWPATRAALQALEATQAIDVATIQTGLATNSNGWYGAVEADNGCIYCIPLLATDILKLDPSRGDLATFVSTGLGSAPNCRSGVFLPSGLIVCMPSGGSYSITIDTANQDAVAKFGEGLFSASIVYRTAVLAGNGIVYAVPYTGNQILRIDPDGLLVSFITINPGSYASSFLGADGRVYGIPYSATAIVVLDPADDSVSYLGNYAGTSKWNGVFLSENGCGYAIPENASTILKIDTLNGGAATTFGSFTGSSKWRGAFYGANGRGYGWPLNSAYILEVDTRNGDAASLIADPTGGTAKHYGGILHRNGHGYSVPGSTVSILKLLSGKVLDPNFVLSRFFNKGL